MNSSRVVDQFVTISLSTITWGRSATPLLTLRTTEFTERPHVGQQHDHTHRMGLLLAARTSTLTDHF
ncbi:hypothetical protein [Streptomyces rubiginosohelvolus]